MSSKFLTELSNDYENLFETEIGYDVIIYSDEEPNFKEIHAHSSILCISSFIGIIVKKRYLNVDEFVIWESLVKWSVSQQNLENDPIKWDKEDIIKVKRELKKFISLIRFHDIGTTNFSRDLVHDLLEYHIVPNIKPKSNLSRSRKQSLKFKLDSNLIEPNHISLFASWIDKKNQDGFSARNFHKNCDNKGATIWVAKIKGSTQLIRGYSSLDWCGNLSWKTTKDNFMFNFKDGEKISTAKVDYVKAESLAIFCHNDYGPTIGIPDNLKIMKVERMIQVDYRWIQEEMLSFRNDLDFGSQIKNQ
ncbi:hypothetical protein C1646_765728 [Rhizophagus diaphanus]|nr:hypothetical protein C1646_765728 [Rhizophagus diaphanus] [Rhizophagus sp. MUCL 43196]